MAVSERLDKRLPVFLGKIASKSALLTALSTVVIAIVLASQVSPYRHADRARVADRALAHSDFAAFYCASLAARTHADPYKTAPLRGCQVERAYRPAGLAYVGNSIDPAPLPGYDFALFAPLTFLPYRIAGLLWIALLVAANLAGSFVLAKLTRMPFGLVVALLAVTNGTICYTFGQPQPIVTLALVAAALSLRIGRPRVAAAIASLTLIEPHVGLPVIVALFLWSAQARVPVVLLCAAFGVLSFAFLGTATNVEYFAKVLPIHAFAEVPVWIQYSLTSVLYTFGVPDALALRLASIQYALTIALGVALAGPLAKRIGAPALVLFPAAYAVVGGPYMHIQQISSAIPFALYVAAFVPALRVWGWVAVVLLALQLNVAGVSTQLIAAIVIFGGALYALSPRPMMQRAAIGAAVFVLYASLNAILLRVPYSTTRAMPTEAQIATATAGFDPSLASTLWAVEARRDVAMSEVSARRVFERLPAWIALLIVVGIGVAAVATGGSHEPLPMRI